MISDGDPDFEARRETAKERINRLDRDQLSENPKRSDFFEAVYEQANGDAAMVPWADLKAKEQLASWLENYSGSNAKAIDIGCGLGDNAELIAKYGYETIAFDFSPNAIDWAKQRFPGSVVNYHVADLFDLPKEWFGAFDLVHECYTLQSIPPETLEKSIPAIANLVKSSGRLLVYSRYRQDGVLVDGPPWPLEKSRLMDFERLGFKLIGCEEFILEKLDRKIPHVFCEWRKHA